MASQRPIAALGVNPPLSFEPQGVPRSPGPTTMLWSPEDGSREVDMSKDSFDRACFCFGGMASPGMPGCKSGRSPCTPGSAQSRACGVKRSHDVPVSPKGINAAASATTAVGWESRARGLAAPQCQPAVPNAIDTPQQHQPSAQQPGTTWLIAQPHARAVLPVAPLIAPFWSGSSKA